MDTPQKTSWYASFSKILLNKKLSISPSTRKSWIQILVTLFITLSIVGVIAWLENEQKDDNSQRVSQALNQTEIANPNETQKKNDGKCEYKVSISTIICLTSDLKLLEQVQNIAVLSAAILFFWDTFDRKKQVERQAWQLIDGAVGSETSGARYQAIEDLYHEDKNSLKGLDADGADLRGINLSGANLERASFKNAILEEANFQSAILKGANFTGAKLQGADFRGAILTDAVLIGANLRCLNKRYKENDEEIRISTKLQGANLRRAILNKAVLYETEFGEYNGKMTDLSYVKFREANISFVKWKNVNIEGALFGGATTGKDELDIEIISKADNYEKAYFPQTFIDKYSKDNLILKLDKEYEIEVQKYINQSNNDLSIIKDSLSSLNLGELIDLLESNLVESTQNADENCDNNTKYIINEIISIRRKLEFLNEYAKQQMLSAQNKNIELTKQEDDDEEKLNLLLKEGEQIDKDIVQTKEDKRHKLQSDN